MVGGVSESVKFSYGFILEEIFEIYKEIKDLPERKIFCDFTGHYESLFQRMDSLITLDLDDNTVRELLNNRELEPIFISIYRFRNLYTIKLETEYADEVLASQSPWDTLEKFPFYRNYLRLVRTEYEGFGLKPGDRILFIGSGPLPLTLIVFLKQHGVKSIGIEQNSMRAALSKKVLDKLEIFGDISIVNGDHFSLNTKDLINPGTGIRAIMIAAQAEPKKEILDYLLKVIPAGCKISYRMYEKGLMKLLNRDFLINSPEGFKEQRVHPGPPAYNTVVFLEKS